MEVAAALAEKAGSVSVVDLVKMPFQLTLGEQLGTFMQKVRNCLKRSIISFPPTFWKSMLLTQCHVMMIWLSPIHATLVYSILMTTLASPFRAYPVSWWKCHPHNFFWTAAKLPYPLIWLSENLFLVSLMRQCLLPGNRILWVELWYQMMAPGSLTYINTIVKPEHNRMGNSLCV